MMDIIRIDHFRGFDAFWEIPGNAETAIKGRWVKAPGEKLFNAIIKELGDVPALKKSEEQSKLSDYTYDCSNCVEKVTGVGGTPCNGCPGSSDYRP